MMTHGGRDGMYDYRSHMLLLHIHWLQETPRSSSSLRRTENRYPLKAMHPELTKSERKTALTNARRYLGGSSRPVQKPAMDSLDTEEELPVTQGEPPSYDVETLLDFRGWLQTMDGRMKAASTALPYPRKNKPILNKRPSPLLLRSSCTRVFSLSPPRMKAHPEWRAQYLNATCFLSEERKF